MIKTLKHTAILATVLALASGAAAQDQLVDPDTVRPSREAGRTANGLAMTPPMGWNSWNRYGCKITEQTIRDAADAIVNRGETPVRISVAWPEIGYPARLAIRVDDLWTGTTTASVKGGFSAVVQPHGVTMVRMAPR